MPKIGKRLHVLRKSKKLSQGELSDIIGVKRNTVTQIECGRQNPTIEQIIELYNYFKLDLHWFLIDGKADEAGICLSDNYVKYRDDETCPSCHDKERIIKEMQKRLEQQEQRIADLDTMAQLARDQLNKKKKERNEGTPES